MYSPSKRGENAYPLSVGQFLHIDLYVNHKAAVSGFSSSMTNFIHSLYTRLGWRTEHFLQKMSRLFDDCSV